MAYLAVNKDGKEVRFDNNFDECRLTFNDVSIKNLNNYGKIRL